MESGDSWAGVVSGCAAKTRESGKDKKKVVIRLIAKFKNIFLIIHKIVAV